MYDSIYVPVDNSDHSNASVHLAVELGAAYEAKLVGSHVYAAKLHDVRFKQMEFTLPDEYKEETELEKQRMIHDALIARGLHLISDSYLDKMEEMAQARGLPFTRKHFDGRNFEAIVNDINDSAYDLVVLGALGQGAVKDSDAGSVCERVLRRTDVDTLVIRNAEAYQLNGDEAILVGLDGSKASYRALDAACKLAKASGRPVEVIVVLSEQNASEEELHQAHLTAARQKAKEMGIRVSTSFQDGGAIENLISTAEKTGAWTLAVGRTGLDGGPEANTVGGVTEGLIRRAPCNILVAGSNPEA